MNSQSRIISLFIGIVATLAVFMAIVFFTTKADTITPTQEVQGVLSENVLKNVKTKTEGLVNYGNLPAVVTSDEIGRDNPFDSY